MDRGKFSTVSPAYFDPGQPENPRKNYRDPSARPSGRSGGGSVKTPHRVSSSNRSRGKRNRA